METIMEEGELSNTKTEAEELFKLCDPDSKGYVTSDDLKHISEDLQLTREQIEVVFQQLDKDGNGILTTEEFEHGLAQCLTEPVEPPKTVKTVDNLIVLDNILENDKGAESSEEELDLNESLIIQSDNLEIKGFLQDKAARQLLSQIETEYPELLPIFDEFLQNLSLKQQQIREETSVLQQSFTRQSMAHEQHIRVLYEEMEGQIQEEKKLITKKKNELEKQLRQELQVAVETKDHDIKDLLEKLLQVTKELEIVSQIKNVTEHENQKLLNEKDMLEQQLDSYKQQLNELHQKLDEAKSSSANEKRDRFCAALELSKKIAWEREALVKQLHLVRSINRRLLDEKDETEDTISVRSKSADNILTMTNEESSVRVESFVSKRGSIMSDYFGIHTSSPEEVNNNEDAVLNCHLRLPAQEPAMAVSPTKLPSTNPFWSEMNNVAGLGMENHLPIKFSSTNPFSRYFQAKEELSSSYTSYTDPDLDSLDHSFSDRSLEKKPSESADCKPPVLCFVHPNNHQTNGLFHQQSSVTESNLLPMESSQLNNDDDLIKFEEVDTVVQPSNKQPQEAEYSEASTKHTPKSLASADPTHLPQTLFKVVFIGDSGVGKSSLINRICGGEFSDKFCTTVGVDFRVKNVLLEGHQVVLQLWDTAGQERFRSITSQYLRKSDGVLIVYDVNSEFSFCNVCSWMASLEKVNNDNVVVAIIGNKLDLSMNSGKKAVCSDEGRNVAAEKDALFFETSAKDGTGIDELILTMARQLQKKQMDDIENCVKLSEKSPEPVLLSKRKCC